MEPSAPPELLRVEELTVVYQTSRGMVRAVSDVSFRVHRGEVLAMVGESGCGKSTAALAIMRLVPPPGKITGGRILPEEHDLLGMNDEALVKIRRKRISMIFQNPLVSLNPVYRVGSQVKEAIVLDQAAQLDAWRKAMDIMAQVRVPDAAERCRHEEPQLVQAGHGHEVAYHRWEELTLTAAPGDDRLATGEDR